MAEYPELQPDNHTVIIRDDNGQEIGRAEYNPETGQTYNVNYSNRTTPRAGNIPYPNRATSGASYRDINVAPTDTMAQDIALLHEKYLQTRLDELEIPEMRARTELEKHQTALNAALAYGQQIGYTVDPQQFAQLLGAQGFGTAASPANPDAKAALMHIWNSRQDIRDWFAANAPDHSPEQAMSVWVGWQPPELQAIGGNPVEYAKTLGWQPPAPGTAPGQGTAPSGIFGRPTLEREKMIQELLANPRNLVEGLLATGMTEREARSTIEQSPVYKQLVSPWFQPPAPTRTVTTPQNVPESDVRAYQQSTGPSGFQFIGGRNLPVQQTLQDIRTDSSRVPLYSSLAAFSGQNPNMFWGDFTEALPRGNRAPGTTTL